MTESDISKIMARADAATKGPWEAEFSQGMDAEWLDVAAPGGCEILSAETQMRVEIVHPSWTIRQKQTTEQHMANLEFVAHARTDVPNLVAALLAERERCAELQKKIA